MSNVLPFRKRRKFKDLQKIEERRVRELTDLRKAGQIDVQQYAERLRIIRKDIDLIEQSRLKYKINVIGIVTLAILSVVFGISAIALRM